MFNSTQTTYERVLSTLHTDLSLYSDMLEALESQQKQLAGRESKRLEETASEITTLVEQAKKNKLQRSDALASLGIKNTPDGMETFLQQLDSHQSEASELWQELIELVEECKEVNQINGRTLNMQREMTETLLAKLNIRSSGSTTYSANGQTEEQTESMINAQA